LLAALRKLNSQLKLLPSRPLLLLLLLPSRLLLLPNRLLLPLLLLPIRLHLLLLPLLLLVKQNKFLYQDFTTKETEETLSLFFYAFRELIPDRWRFREYFGAKCTPDSGE
jgi:hypothetical protein